MPGVDGGDVIPSALDLVEHFIPTSVVDPEPGIVRSISCHSSTVPVPQVNTVGGILADIKAELKQPELPGLSHIVVLSAFPENCTSARTPSDVGRQAPAYRRLRFRLDKVRAIVRDPVVRWR